LSHSENESIIILHSIGVYVGLTTRITKCNICYSS
jgi:hypothetical protein